MKKRLPLIIGILLMVIGLGILVYHSIVICLNEKYSTNTINSYDNKVDTLSEEEIDKYIEDAQEYNDRLKGAGLEYGQSSEVGADGYENILNFQDGIIGYIKIPAIDVNLPIYHGYPDPDTALSKGAVHAPNTAFPVGGSGNHSVIAAHTAYADQIFFDNLYKLQKGDKVYIIILNKTYTYVVVERNIVEPHDTSPCTVIDSRDLLSLVTCHPYAQNTHRLIVTSERVITEDASSDKEGDSPEEIQVESSLNNTVPEISVLIEEPEKGVNKLNMHEIIVLAYILFVLIAIVVIFILLLLALIKRIKKRKREKPYN